MTAAVLTAVLIASGGILSPAQVLITLFLLSARSGLRKAMAYFAGYAGAYTVVGVTTVLVSSRLRETQTVESAPGDDDASMWFFVALGAVLLVVALFRWQKGPSPKVERPKLFDTLDKLSAPKLTGLGMAIALINIKNLTIFLSSLAVIVDADLPKMVAVAAAVASALVVSIAIFGPIAVFVVGRARAEPWLAALRDKLERNTQAITLAVLVLVGGGMLIRGVVGLVSF